MSHYENFAGLALFVKVVESGSFATAAARLNVSRSSVGKTIARLEERLGVKLIHRTTRTQCLTEDGQLFYERCLRAVEEIREGTAMLDSGRTLVQGKLRVSAPFFFGCRCVAPVLVGLGLKHPGLEIEIDFDDRRVEVIEEGFDFVVRAGPMLSESELRLVSKKLATQRMVVCASPAYLAAHGSPRELNDIHGHQSIVYHRSIQNREWHFIDADDSHVVIRPRARLRLDNYEAIADAAAAGFGLAWLPYWLIRDRVTAGELIQVLDNKSSKPIEYYALWPQTKHLPLRTRVALDELSRQLPDMM